MEKDIILPKSNELKLRLVNNEGKPTGEYLTFDLEDIELQLRYQEMVEKEKKNRDWLQKELVIINKRQDVKGKKLLTKNEEDQLKAVKKFFDEETEIYNMFLGENGVQKILNGRKFGWTTLRMIDKIIEEQILPQLDKQEELLEKEIINKYSAKKEEVI